MIVGISGKAGHGKDTAAQVLIDRGFQVVRLAEPLRDLLLKINPIVTEANGFRLADVVRAYGWEKAKRNLPEVRRLMQEVGGGARDVLGENVWTDACERVLTGHDGTWSHNVVVPDVRYPSEFDMIDSLGGTLLRVVRENVSAVREHDSETALDNHVFDALIVNDGTVADLHTRVLTALSL